MTGPGSLRRVGWLLGAALAVGGCNGGSGSTAAPPTTATPLARSATAPAPTTAATPAPTGDTPNSSRAAATRVADAGLGCTDFAAEKPATANLGPTAAESGVCTVGGVKLTIGGYASPADAEVAFGAAQTLACQAAKDAVNGTAVVVAGNQLLGLWNGNVEVSKQIAAAVAGQVRILSC